MSGGLVSEGRLDEIFQSFSGGQQTSTIREVYDMLPSITPESQRVYLMAKALALKWELTDVLVVLEEYYRLARGNRSLGFMSNMKQMLKAVTLEEQLRGVKIQASPRSDQ